MTVAAINSQALWFTTRGLGLVSVVLLSAVVVLGIMQVHGVTAGPDRQRFVVTQLHRNLSLLAVVFIAVHIVTVIVDGFAPIGWLDAVVPFLSPYRTIWLGIGTIAFDLVLAIVITSLLRVHIGYGTWKAVHWLSYACWAVAMVHGLGAGSDGREFLAQITYAASAVVVAVAVCWRLVRDRDHRRTARTLSALVGSVVLIGATVWALQGPMQPGWPKKAGTPASLLTGTDTSASTTAGFDPPFDASVRGSVSQSGNQVGAQATITLTGTIENGASGAMSIAITGTLAGNGGIQMRSSTVSTGPTDDPTRYTGTVTALQGNAITATLTDAAGGRLIAQWVVQFGANGTSFTGTMAATR